MPSTVPVVRSLAAIYPDDAVAEQTQRWQHLLAAFRARYGRPADFVARSPGRVNIIGEHIDYSLYSVLPMAITADCLVAVAVVERPEDTTTTTTYTIEVANVDDAKFPARTATLPRDGPVPIDASVHEWTNYFKSGLRGALEHLRQAPGFAAGPCSLQVLVDGRVPVGGGLSSSAAFTSASALAVLAAHHSPLSSLSIDKTMLTELAIVSERHVGVNSGGMDQAASVFAERGAALLIDFAPALAAAPVSFPATTPAVCFVVAQSFVAADKFVTGPVHYNLRVVECALAAACVGAALLPTNVVLPRDASPLGISLRSVQDALQEQQLDRDDPDPTTALRQFLARVDATLVQDDGYTREEVASILGISLDDLHARYTAAFPVRAERFRLRQRALHVLGEALRVREFVALLQAPADDCTPAAMGAILDASQASCRDLYDCSAPELDQLCAIARRAGALGSRLTGAGWGGCTVHLVPVDRVAAVRAAWDAEYYAGRGLTEAQRAAAVVVSQPGSGSAVWDGEL